MKRDSKIILDEAIRCFKLRRPGQRLSEEARAALKVELESICRMYLINCMLRATSVPFTKEWKKWRAKLPPDPDFPSLKELPPRRGRPVDFHANQLVMDCKRLLIRYGCKYGVSRNRDRLYESPLKKLAELIHELSGVSALTQDKPWQDVVERLSSRSKRAKTIGKGNHETGLEEPMAAGEDPDFDAWFEEILKSWGY